MAKYQMSEAQKATQFKKGQSGNPGGFDQHTRAKMTLNAKKATELRTRILNALESRIEGIIYHAIREGEMTAEDADNNKLSEGASARIMSLLDGDINRLLTDTENRGFGNPTQPTRTEDAPRRDIDDDMSPEEAADAYRREVEG
jgi:hypothetical protein